MATGDLDLVPTRGTASSDRQSWLQVRGALHQEQHRAIPAATDASSSWCRSPILTHDDPLRRLNDPINPLATYDIRLRRIIVLVDDWSGEDIEGLMRDFGKTREKLNSLKREYRAKLKCEQKR